MKLKTELSPEERAYSYSKYYYMPDDTPDPVVRQLIEKGPCDPKDALRFEDINELYKPGYLPIEMGYCIMPDGTGFVSEYVRMPNVTINMINWWFTWHFVRPKNVPDDAGNLKYKIWCPSQHWDTSSVAQEGTDRRCDSSLPYVDRSNIGGDDYIDEALFNGDIIRVIGHPVDLDTLGISMESRLRPDFGTYVAAYCRPDDGVGGIFFHQFRELREGGIEERFRIWLGYKLENGKFVRDPDCPKITEDRCRSYINHGFVENLRLARFLPSLYREEGWKPVGAD